MCEDFASLYKKYSKEQRLDLRSDRKKIWFQSTRRIQGCLRASEAEILSIQFTFNKEHTKSLHSAETARGNQRPNDSGRISFKKPILIHAEITLI